MKEKMRKVLVVAASGSGESQLFREVVCGVEGEGFFGSVLSEAVGCLVEGDRLRMP
jgi:hypothetical protein